MKWESKSCHGGQVAAEPMKIVFDSKLLFLISGKIQQNNPEILTKVNDLFFLVCV
jgi:hypothetical protein